MKQHDLIKGLTCYYSWPSSPGSLIAPPVQ